MDKLYHNTFDSPCGKIRVTASDIGISRIEFVEKFKKENSSQIVESCIDQLKDYFDRKREDFDIPLDLSGHTDFHIQVWNQLLKIPYASTCSYMDIAKKINNIPAIRAVGGANGANPIPIVIPCHRVIGSNGSLTGFSGGIDNKKMLLSIENPTSFGLQTSLIL